MRTTCIRSLSERGIRRFNFESVDPDSSRLGHGQKVEGFKPESGEVEQTGSRMDCRLKMQGNLFCRASSIHVPIRLDSEAEGNLEFPGNPMPLEVAGSHLVGHENLENPTGPGSLESGIPRHWKRQTVGHGNPPPPPPGPSTLPGQGLLLVSSLRTCKETQEHGAPECGAPCSPTSPAHLALAL